MPDYDLWRAVFLLKSTNTELIHHSKASTILITSLQDERLGYYSFRKVSISSTIYRVISSSRLGLEGSFELKLVS